jgi:sigma-B regulation protein RsbU (phosphoserine phosphatase)
MKAAEEVGGNFYDFYMIDDEHMALTVAGVSGKGVPAALFMVAAKAMLKNDALAAAMERGPGKADWAKVMSRVNCQICENNDYTMFMTVFFAVLNLATGELICVNGGHTPPFLGCASAGNTEWQPLRDEGKKYVVGIFEEAEYAEKRLRLHPGDLLFLCTEGVAGAMGADGSPYTKKRLQETLCRTGTADISMEKLLASVQADIDRHVGGAGQRDDLTMLAIRFLG